MIEQDDVKLFPRAQIVFFVVAFLFVTPRLGRAQTADCFQDPMCSRLHEEGKVEAKAGHIDAALQAYEQAYQFVPDPMLLWKLARLFDQVGRLNDARTYYRQYVASGDAVKSREAKLRLDQLSHEPPPPQQPAPPPPVRLAEKEPLSPKQTPARDELWRKGWLWGVVGAGVAGIALGVGLGVSAHRPNVSAATEVRPF